MSPTATAQHVARERARVTKALRRAVWRRDGGRCYLCGVYLGSDAGSTYRVWRWLRGRGGPWHLEHTVPLSRGGITSLSTCRVACSPCNLSKGAKTPFEFRLWRWRRRVARWWWVPVAGWVAWDNPQAVDAIVDTLTTTIGGGP